ncbi:MAG: ATPase [Clostridiales bacterium]|nr:ATPase [Clostridiales bacterium]
MAGKPKEIVGNMVGKAFGVEMPDAGVQAAKLLYSVFGFVPATDFTDSALLLSNLGYALSRQGYNVCLADLKVFYPNLYLYLGIPQNKRGNGLLAIIKDNKADLREEVKPTKYEGLYLLSPSPQDLMEEYFDFGLEKVCAVIEVLKKTFDIVLLDIPNDPPLEFCLGAMKQSHMGFFIASERIDAVSNIMRLLDFAGSVGISAAKFANIIFMNMQDIKYDFNTIKKLRLNVVAGLPLVKGAAADALEGKLYIKDNPLASNLYKREIASIIASMFANN